MRKLIVFAAAVSLAGAVVGCTSTGQLDPNPGARLLADVECIAAATGAGLSIAANPAVGGAATAVGVLNAIHAVGESNVPASVLGACKQTLSNAVQDAQGLAARAKTAAAK